MNGATDKKVLLKSFKMQGLLIIYLFCELKTRQPFVRVKYLKRQRNALNRVETVLEKEVTTDNLKTINRHL